MRTWDKSYSGFFRKTLNTLEADEIESYLSSRNKGYTEGQLKEALEKISLSGRYENGKPPLTEISMVLSRIMAEKDLESLPDGCPVCRWSGWLFVDTPNANAFSLPCQCVKGDYIKQHFKPYRDYKPDDQVRLNKNIAYYFNELKAGNFTTEKAWAELSRRLDEQGYSETKDLRCII